MAMVSLKRTTADKAEEKEQMAAMDEGQESYAWGLRVHLEGQELDKLPSVRALKVGDEITFMATARVKSKRGPDVDEDIDDESIELQIQEMGVGQQAESSDAVIDRMKSMKIGG